MQDAFDDLNSENDDDDESLQNSINTSNSLNIPAANAMFNGLDDVHQPLVNTQHDAAVLHLQNVVASKNEEVRNLTGELCSERAKFKKAVSDLEKRLAIAEGEKERMCMNRQQTHELFVKSKQALSERDEQMTELNTKIKSLDARNLDLLAELERTKSLLSETQHKYMMIERNQSSEKHTDSMIKQLNDRHSAQIDMLQQQINTMRTKVEDRDDELKRLKVQNNELLKSREEILHDKSDTIGDLKKRLDETQRQYQELILQKGHNDSLVNENAHSMRKIKSLEQENLEMQRKIGNLVAQ